MATPGKITTPSPAQVRVRRRASGFRSSSPRRPQWQKQEPNLCVCTDSCEREFVPSAAVDATYTLIYTTIYTTDDAIPAMTVVVLALPLGPRRCRRAQLTYRFLLVIFVLPCTAFGKPVELDVARLRRTPG